MATSFKVRVGFHSNGEKVYRKGQVFQSDKPLNKMFPNKFDIVATNEKSTSKKKSSKKGEGKAPRYNKAEVPEEIGKDVSQKFPDAINLGLRVWQTEDGEHNITEENDLYTPLNNKPLTRLGVKKFLLNR